MDATMLDEVMPWLAVIGSWICFGSFAVPMKWPSVVDAQVNPLVYQCYKTFWTAASAHFILLFEPFQFTVWGLASGFAWVPAGVAAVVAVQNIGITCGQAIWQVSIILSSLCWGFLVLRDETVRSVPGTLAAVTCMVLGMLGMTFAFSLQANDHDTDELQEPLLESIEEMGTSTVAVRRRTYDLRTATAESAAMRSTLPRQRCESEPAPSQWRFKAWAGELHFSKFSFKERVRSRRSLSDLRFGTDDLIEDPASTVSPVMKTSVGLGISAALFNGFWGGSNLVPSHLAPIHGVHFVISFGLGALVANIFVMLVYLILCKVVWHSPLPSLQVRVMALPGFLSGILWSAGNLCALYAVDRLGQGVGNSLVQCSVIISGLWGILYYRELSGAPVLWWFLCCFVALFGVAGVVYQRN